MPIFKLDTNIHSDKVTDAVLKELSKVIAETLGKPESYVTVVITPEKKLVFGGTGEPCGIASLLSIGKLGVAENKKHSAALATVLENRLGIPRDRVYIHFIDSKSADVGYNGTTFHDILG